MSDIFDTITEQDFYGGSADAFDSLTENDIYGDQQPVQSSNIQAGIAPDSRGGIAKRLDDLMVSGAKGMSDLIYGGVGLLDIPTMGYAGKLADKILPNQNDVNAGFEQLYSPEQQEANRKVNEAEGFVGTAAEMLKNPSTIVQSTVESLPAMIAGGGIAKGIMKAAPAVSPLIASAAGEGTIGAGQAAEQIRQANTDRTLGFGQTAASIASGIGTGAFNLIGGRLAKRFGFEDPDLLAAGFRTKMTADEIAKLPLEIQEQIKKNASKSAIRKIIEGGISEGVFEELPQSVQEQMWQNAAMGQPLFKGVGQAGVQGMFAGGFMGAGANVSSSFFHSSDDKNILDPNDNSRFEKSKDRYLTDLFGKLQSGEWGAGEIQAIYDNMPDEDPLKSTLQSIFFSGEPSISAGISETGPNVYGTAEPWNIRNQEAMDSFIGPVETISPSASPGPGLVTPAQQPAPGTPIAGIPPTGSRGAGIKLPPASYGQPVDQAQMEKEIGQRSAQQQTEPENIQWQPREKTDIDVSANEAATSPFNQIPEPTEAQKKAGNYKKGHIKVNGLDIAVENPEGSIRSGTDEDGKEWETTMQGHYGYFNRTEGKDGDQVDVFVGPEKSNRVYVVDQINPKTGKFDEHKVVMNVPDEQSARDLYLSNYEPGWKGLGAITEMKVMPFKKWLNKGRQTKPVGDITHDRQNTEWIQRGIGEGQEPGRTLQNQEAGPGPTERSGNVQAYSQEQTQKITPEAPSPIKADVPSAQTVTKSSQVAASANQYEADLKPSQLASISKIPEQTRLVFQQEAAKHNAQLIGFENGKYWIHDNQTGSSGNLVDSPEQIGPKLADNRKAFEGEKAKATGKENLSVEPPVKESLTTQPKPDDTVKYGRGKYTVQEVDGGRAIIANAAGEKVVDTKDLSPWQERKRGQRKTKPKQTLATARFDVPKLRDTLKNEKGSSEIYNDIIDHAISLKQSGIDNYRQFVRAMKQRFADIWDKIVSVMRRLWDTVNNQRGEIGSVQRNPQTRTEAFKKWFGDSKIVDENGDPKVVYHGTGDVFDVFDKTSDIGFHFGTKLSAQQRMYKTGVASVEVVDNRPTPVAMVTDKYRNIKTKEDASTDKEYLVSLLLRKVAYPRATIENIVKEMTDDDVSNQIEYYEKLPDQDNYKKRLKSVDNQKPFTVEVNGDKIKDFKTKREADAFANRKSEEVVKPYSFYLSIKNPLRIKDLGVWSVSEIADFSKISEKEKNFVMEPDSLSDKYNNLRIVLSKKGYDGIVYTNEVEDIGSDSYIAFEPTQIKSATGNTGSFDPNNPSILMSMRSPSYSGTLKAARVSQAIEPLIKGWKNAPDFKVVQSQDELPQGIKDYMKSVGAENHYVDGAYHKGKIYLVADNLTSTQDAVKTMLHETFGHYGIRQAMGETLNPVLRQVYEAKTDEIKKIADEYDFDLMNPTDKLLAADEWLARHVSENEQSSWTDKVVKVIRAWIRSYFPKLKMSDAEIRGLLDAARKSVVQGQTNQASSAVASFQKSKKADKWFSQMQKALESKLPNQGNPKLIRNMIESWAKNGEFKSEELEWSGVQDWLGKQEGKVTKQQVLDYLAENNVRVEEVEKGIGLSDEKIDLLNARANEIDRVERLRDSGGQISHDEAQKRISEIDERYKGYGLTKDDFASKLLRGEKTQTKFSNYQLLGGENYRELLLTLPDAKQSPERIAFDAFKIKMQNKYVAAQWVQKLTASEESERERLAKAAAMSEDKQYQSSHWEEPNVLAHVRFNERTDADGKRVLFIEEVQSDWHQKGRKEGYKNSNKYNELLNAYRRGYNLDGSPFTKAQEDEMNSLQKSESSGVPNAPFKKTWPMLAMKRMVRYAAENGFDSIAWTPGDVQADRYDLSKQVGDFYYWFDDSEGDFLPDKNEIGLSIYDKSGSAIMEQEIVPKSKLEDYIGKDAAKRVLEGDRVPAEGQPEGVYALEQEDLKVGGEGMKGFYDKILPSAVNKFFNKAAWGKARVGKTTFEDNYFEPASFDENGIGSDEGREIKNEIEAWSLPITPEMKQKALREGMPLFAIRKPGFKSTNPQDHVQKKTRWQKEKDAFIRATVSHLPRNMPKMTMFEQILKSPEWYDHPVIQKIVRYAIDRHDLFYDNYNEINEVNDPKSAYETVTDATQALKSKGLKKLQSARGQTSQEYKQLMEMIDFGDTNGADFTGKTIEERLEKFEQHFRDKGFSEDAIKTWRLHRYAYDKALDKLLEPMRQLEEKAKEHSIFTNSAENPFDKFMSTRDQKGKKQWLSLKEAIAEMESWRGFYAPRIRESGRWVVKAAKGPAGYQQYVRYHKTTRWAAERLSEKLKSEGYHSINVEENTGLGEDVLQHVKTMATAELLDKAAENIAGGTGINAEAALRFHDELVTQVADMIRARGFRSTMIHRKQGSVIKGYIEDPLERYVRYTANTSSGLAKAMTAYKMTEAFFGVHKKGKRIGGIQSDKEPRAYAVAQKYIMEQLRNADQTDRVVGLAKAFTTMKYLGLNPRAAFINMTAMVTTVPAALRQYATDGKASFRKVNLEMARAGKDYALYMKNGLKGNLTDAEFNYLEEIKQQHYDDPQYTRDAIGLINSIHGKGFARAMNWAMYLFGKTEQWNRGSTMLAGYRLHQGNDASKKEAARIVTEKAHGVYGRATLPSWAQGSNPAAKAGQMVYVYQKFGHNWLQLCYDLGFKKKDMKSMAWALASPVVLGGAAAIPLKSVGVAIISAIMSAMGYDRDPEKVLWDNVREYLGDTAERGLRYGVTGLVGVDISGSLSFDPTLSLDIRDYSGAIGGAIKDIGTAGHMLTTGKPLRAAETLLPTAAGNIVRAYREKKEGASTTKGNRIFDEKGRPYQPGAGETALRVAGFRSSRRATVQSRQWEQKKEYYNFKDRRDEIYESYKAYLSNKDPDLRRKVLDKIAEYNKDIRKQRLYKQIPFITRQTLIGISKGMRRPSKIERLQ